MYDVLVIGGGITGAGTARDCAMRGLKVALVEKADFANGATGRNHGLLHSGARYAMTDPVSARECITENLILKKIASHCIEPVGGLFVSLPGDSLDYQKEFIEACKAAGIETEKLSPEQARKLEPSVNPSLIGAVRVPDASVDPFRLTMANVLDAVKNGAEVFTDHEVTSLVLTDAGIVGGAVVLDKRTGKEKTIRSKMTVNAAGIWGQKIAAMAGIRLNMMPAKGALLIFGHRVNNMVLNRCRKPADGDILVPDDTVSVIGTTSSRVPIDSVDDLKVTEDEVRILYNEATALVPELANTRIIRTYAGVRPLVAMDDDPTGRETSRGIVCYDHLERDNVGGFVTITGGKMMTYRKMAETATDLVCRKIGKTAECMTARTPLPGSEPWKWEARDHASGKAVFPVMAAAGRHGQRAETIDFQDDDLTCECEEVSVSEIRYAIRELGADNLERVRRRTRLGMGTCQGTLCACRAASLLCEETDDSSGDLSDLNRFLRERWKGMKPVAWGDTLAQAQLNAYIYQNLLGLKG